VTYASVGSSNQRRSISEGKGSIVYSCIPRLAFSTRQHQTGNCLEVFLTRPLRVELPGAVYHVIARERKPIFRDDMDREVYLERLAKCRASSSFGFWPTAS